MLTFTTRAGLARNAAVPSDSLANVRQSRTTIVCRFVFEKTPLLQPRLVLRFANSVLIQFVHYDRDSGRSLDLRRGEVVFGGHGVFDTT